MPAAIIIIATALFLLIPVGFSLDCDYDGLRLSIEALHMRFKIRPYSKTGSGEAPKKNRRSIKAKKLFLNLSFEEWTKVVKIALKALERLKRHACFDRIVFLFVSGNPDPAVAAMHCSVVNSAVASVLPLFENAFKVKKRDISISVDYYAAHSSIEFGFTLSVRAGQLIYIMLLTIFAIGFVYAEGAFNKYRERKASRGKQTRRFNA